MVVIDPSVAKHLEHYVTYKQLWTQMGVAIILNLLGVWAVCWSALGRESSTFTAGIASANAAMAESKAEVAATRAELLATRVEFEKKLDKTLDLFERQNEQMRQLLVILTSRNNSSVDNSSTANQTVTIAPGENPLLRKEWLTADEMAVIHNCNRDTVYRRRDEGREGFTEWKREGQIYLFRNPLAGIKRATDVPETSIIAPPL